MPNFLLHCLQRYECTFNDLLSCHSIKHIISHSVCVCVCVCVSASYTDVQYTMCKMVTVKHTALGLAGIEPTVPRIFCVMILMTLSCYDDF